MSHYFYITPNEYDQAEKNGVDAFNLERRIRLLGWDKERAIKTPLKKQTNRKYWVDLAKQNGIGYSTFMNRVNNLGWDEERAATEPLQDRKKAAAKATEKIRKIPSRILRLAEQNGIAYHTLRARIKKRWEPERAATQALLTRKQIGQIGAHNARALYGDIGRVHRNGSSKFTFSKEILTPDKYPITKTRR